MLRQLDVQKAHKPESWLYLRFFREAIGLEQFVNISFSFDDSSTRFHQDIQSHPEQPLQQQCFPFCRKSRNALLPTDCRNSLHLWFFLRTHMSSKKPKGAKYVENQLKKYIRWLFTKRKALSLQRLFWMRLETLVELDRRIIETIGRIYQLFKAYSCKKKS